MVWNCRSAALGLVMDNYRAHVHVKLAKECFEEKENDIGFFLIKMFTKQNKLANFTKKKMITATLW